MKLKDVFARSCGVAAGIAVAVVLPHVACLGGLTAIFVGAGAAAPVAFNAAYIAGIGVLAAGAGAALYGLRRSNEACCLLWGETPRVRAKKAGAMAAAAFAVAALANTVLDRGPDSSLETARYLEFARATGTSVWTALNDICRGPRP